MRSLLSAAAAVTLASTAGAQTSCSNVADDQERLACYDAAAQLDRIIEHGRGSEWTATTEPDPLTDIPTTVLSLEAEQVTSCFQRRPVLYVRCEERQLNIYVSHGCLAPGQDGIHGLRARFGTEEPQILTLVSDTADQAVGSWNNDQARRILLDPLLRTDRFVIEVTPYRDPPQTIVFVTAGLREELGRSKTACSTIEDALEAAD